MEEIKRKLSRKGYFAKIYIFLVVFILLPLLLLGMLYLLILSLNSYHSFCSEQILKINDMKGTVEARLSAVEDDLVSLGTFGPDSKIDFTSKEQLYSDVADSLNSLSREHSNLVTSTYYLSRIDYSLIYPGYGIYEFPGFYDTEWTHAIDYRPILRRLPVRQNINSALAGNSYFMSFHPTQDVLTLLYGSTYSNVYVVNISLDNIKKSILNEYSFANGDAIFTLTGANSESDAENTSVSVQNSSDDTNYYKENGKLIFNGAFYHNLIRFNIIMDTSCVYQSMHSYLLYYLFLTLTLAILLIVIAKFAAKKLYSPVENLYNSVRLHNRLTDDYFNISLEADELETLKMVFDDMNAHHEASVKTIDLYRAAESSASLGMVLESNLTTERFIQHNPEFAAYKLFKLFLVSVEYELGSRAEYISNLSELLRIYLGTTQANIVSLLSRSRIGVVIAANDEAELNDGCMRLQSALNAIVPNNGYACSSDVIYNFSDLPGAYRLCLDLIGRSEFFCICDTILTSENITDNASGELSDEAVTYEARIIRAVVGNNPDEIHSITDSLCNELSQHSVSFAHNSLINIIATIETELQLQTRVGSNVIQDTIGLRNINEFKTYINELLENACSVYNQGEGVEAKYCADAKAYLEANYRTDIDILSVASALDLSYPYLSKIFKSTYNVTLSDYLNSYRIKQSCELLKTTNLTLENIAAKVGYNNTQSYQRFFKKYKGITPTEFRKAAQGGLQ